jgi:hypothetical protein
MSTSDILFKAYPTCIPNLFSRKPFQKVVSTFFRENHSSTFSLACKRLFLSASTARYIFAKIGKISQISALKA